MFTIAIALKQLLTCLLPAHVLSVDKSVRSLVAKLKEMGQYENTILIFTSDVSTKRKIV